MSLVLLFGTSFFCRSSALNKPEFTTERERGLEERISLTLAGPVARIPLRDEWNLDSTEIGLALNPLSREVLADYYQTVCPSRGIALVILRESAKAGVPPALAFAVASVESDFRPRLESRNVNRSCDRGLFQLNSASYPRLSAKDFFDVATNARFGCGHLRFALDYGGNVVCALAIYNAGLRRLEKGTLPDSTYSYVAKVMKEMNRFEAGLKREAYPRLLVSF